MVLCFNFTFLLIVYGRAVDLYKKLYFQVQRLFLMEILEPKNTITEIKSSLGNQEQVELPLCTQILTLAQDVTQLHLRSRVSVLES